MFETNARRSGRTTRMVIEAVDRLRDGQPVVVVGHCKTSARILEELVMVEASKKGVPVDKLSSDTLENLVDQSWLNPFTLEAYDLSNHYSIDHSAIENMYTEIFAKWKRYDL